MHALFRIHGLFVDFVDLSAIKPRVLVVSQCTKEQIQPAGQPGAVIVMPPLKNILEFILTNENTGRECEAPAELLRATNLASIAC